MLVEGEAVDNGEEVPFGGWRKIEATKEHRFSTPGCTTIVLCEPPSNPDWTVNGRPWRESFEFDPFFPKNRQPW
jgi:hypothetical protein